MEPGTPWTAGTKKYKLLLTTGMEVNVVDFGKCDICCLDLRRFSIGVLKILGNSQKEIQNISCPQRGQ
jgi:hypothetical protein